MGRAKTVPVPEVGGEAPEFNLPSAQGGQLRLSMRTARGPVVVVFYEGPTEEDVAYFEALARREDEINLAGGSVVGIGVAEPDDARDLARRSGIKSYVLYDYARVATGNYGLLEKSRERGYYARPAAFVVSPDRKVAQAWIGERPEPGELLAAVSAITGLPKPAEETDEEGKEAAEKPRKARPAREPGDGQAAAGEAGTGERKRLSPEEREKRRAERRATREAAEKPEASEPEAAAAEKPEDAGEAKPEKAAGAEGETAGEPEAGGGPEAVGDDAGTPEEAAATPAAPEEAEAGSDGEVPTTAEAGPEAGHDAPESGTKDESVVEESAGRGGGAAGETDETPASGEPAERALRWSRRKKSSAPGEE